MVGMINDRHEKGSYGNTFALESLRVDPNQNAMFNQYHNNSQSSNNVKNRCLSQDTSVAMFTVIATAIFLIFVVSIIIWVPKSKNFNISESNDTRLLIKNAIDEMHKNIYSILKFNYKD